MDRRLTRSFVAPALIVSAAIAAGSVNVASARAHAAERIQLTVAARRLQPGELAIVTATTTDAVESAHLRVFGRDIPAFAVDGRTWEALVGIDVDVRPGRYTAVLDAQGSSESLRGTTTLLVQPRTFPKRELQVDPAFVNPPPELDERIAREAKELDALWMHSSPSRLWSGVFQPPVPGHGTSRFGARSFFNGQPRSRHAGEDFPNPEGTPVVAPNAGRVVLARELYFAGNIVVIDHGLGLFSLLEHLSAIEVSEGAEVRTGQRVGRVGATGRVTGPHLHWAVRANGARVDPLSVLASLGG